LGHGRQHACVDGLIWRQVRKWAWRWVDCSDVWSGMWCMIHEDERTVDALAPAADEGRGHAAKSPGDELATGDPGVSEWGNPSLATVRHLLKCG
jgi:hypothetical protein